MRIIFLILIGALYFVPLKGQKNYKEAIDSGDFRRDKGHYDTAINFYFAAEAFDPVRKGEVKDKINTVFKKIDSVKRVAVAEKGRADTEAKNAKDKAKQVIREKERVDSARKVFYLFNLVNAPYKYVRLIRDGPKDEDKIRENSFDSKLIAYSNHLDIIKDSLDKIPLERLNKANIPSAKKDYEDLREDLYFNNDLYEKIYFCLDFHGAKEEVLVNSPLPDSNYFRFQQFKGEQETYYISADSVVIKLKNYSREDSSFSREGQKFTSITIADTDTLKRIICATDDHYIFIYEPGPDGKPISMDTIAMGTQVSAIDFVDSSKIIFFGTKGGDIGFIQYDEKEKKYQPVYSTENYFSGSTITAIDFFVKDGVSFMLVAGFDGKAVVYKVDSNFLVEGYKFSGNILPDPKKELGDILHARYDEKTKEIIMETTKGFKFYTWDPFTFSALEKFRKTMESSFEKNIKEQKPNIMEATNFYNKSK